MKRDEAVNGRAILQLHRAKAALWRAVAAVALAGALAACGNSPWPDDSEKANVVRSAMTENTPRHLDPTASYWSNDTLVTYQVYEPPYGYHYLKRPFELVPKAATAVVKPVYLDKDGNSPDDAPADQVPRAYDADRSASACRPAREERQGEYKYHSMKPAVGHRTRWTRGTARAS
jgi:hypothetical protein